MATTVGGTGATDGAEAPAGEEVDAPVQRRRPRTEVQEVIDELAQETKRSTLLAQVEQQVKGQHHVSRILFAFNVADDKKTQNMVEHEFQVWREEQEKHAEDLTGVLLFIGPAGLQFLEGPTELIFKAIEFFDTLSRETKEVVKSSKQDRPDMFGKPPLSPAVAPARPALVGPLRVLYFTELHGVRASRAWYTVSHSGKAQTGSAQIQLEEETCSELVFTAYKKVLLFCLRVSELADDDVRPEVQQAQSKKVVDTLPLVEEATTLLSKQGSDLFFNFAEFSRVFIKPFHLVLHSELLWPMPPALSY